MPLSELHLNLNRDAKMMRALLVAYVPNDIVIFVTPSLNTSMIKWLYVGVGVTKQYMIISECNPPYFGLRWD